MKYETEVHKRSAQKHFNARSEERLGTRLNRHDAKNIISRLVKGAYGDGWSSGSDIRRRWYFIDYDNEHFWVLYDKKLRRLVTCLDGYTIPRPVWKETQENFCHLICLRK